MMRRWIGLSVTVALFSMARPGEAAAPGSPPDEAEILRALPPVRSVPGLVEVSREDVQITSEPLGRVLWRCTTYYRQVIRLPRLGVTLSLPQVRQVYIGDGG